MVTEIYRKFAHKGLKNVKQGFYFQSNISVKIGQCFGNISINIGRDQAFFAHFFLLQNRRPVRANIPQE